MSSYVESLHPRGQVANAGQFAAKANDAPGTTLVAPLSERLDALRVETSARLGEARAAESALWLAFALETYGDGDSTYFDFEAEDLADGSRRHTVITPSGVVDDESVSGAIPSHLVSGDGTVRFVDGAYVSELGDRDGNSVELSTGTGERLSSTELAGRAQAASEYRTLVDDTAEHLAIAEAFERATELSGADSATFRRGTVPGMTTLHCLESGMHIAATDDVQAQALRRAGQSDTELRVNRQPGSYTIHRLSPTPGGGISKTITIVDGTDRRWGDDGR